MRAGRSPGRPCSRRGAAAAELALILPILLVIVLGAVDFGRFIHDYLGVTNAARAGASHGVLHRYLPAERGTWLNEIYERAKDEMFEYGDPRRDLLTVEANDFVDNRTTYGARRVRVVATYPFRTAIPWPGVPNRLTLVGTVEMRVVR